MTDYVVKSKVKELVNNMNMRMSSDAVTELSKKVKWILEKAGERADKNGRKTIMPQDL